MTIVLFGATGYTGRLVSAVLNRKGAHFVLAGRSEQRLRGVSETVAGGAAVEVAALDDPAALRRLLADRAVVINCAGPFTALGEPVVRAAVETRTHYLDSTGEQGFMRLVFDRYGEAAERAGVALVPAMGFDYAPGDAIARLTCERAGPVDELVVAYSVEQPAMSRGTATSVLEILAAADQRFTRERLEFPGLGRRTVVAYPAGEVVTVPRHSDAGRVRAVMDTRAFAPARVAPLVARVLPVAAALLRTPVRRLVERAATRLPEGPSPQVRLATEFVVVASGGGVTGVVRGCDPYGITARALVWGADQMAAGDYQRAGALGPAAAFDPSDLLDALDLTWSVEGGRVAAGATR